MYNFGIIRVNKIQDETELRSMNYEVLLLINS